MRSLSPTCKIAGRFSCLGIRRRLTPPAGECHLARRQVVSARVSSGVRVACRSGCIWITSDRSSQDLILQAGESMLTSQRTKLVIEAIEEAAIEIHAPANRRRIRENAAARRAVTGAPVF